MLNSRLPPKLYKYCSFSANTLRVLTQEEVYFANPSSFNDPLDCNPTIDVNVDRLSLEKLFIKIFTDKKNKKEALSALGNCRYLSSEFGDYKTDAEAGAYYDGILASRIQGAFIQEMNRFGVLSLAKRWHCPLMWSHYADQHHGICIEYTTKSHTPVEIQSVSYNKPRAIRASDLIEWKLHDSTEAKNAIRETFFFVKAKPWKYEQEWRAVKSDVGLACSPFTIYAIYFGLRCPYAVQTTLVKLFDGDHRHIKFYELCVSDENFSLKRREVNTDEIKACGVSSSPLRDFMDLSSDNNTTC